MYSVEDRKILSILKRYEQPKKSCFLKIKEALSYDKFLIEIKQHLISACGLTAAILFF